jgi:two-component system chemotaxis sensor kinase CheA
MNDDDEIIQDFLEESRENLDGLDRALVELEGAPGDPDLLAGVFRTFHTIKGTCGFLGFAGLEAVTHAGEHLLGAVRAGELPLDGPRTSVLLELVDVVRDALDRIEATGSEGEADHGPLLERLGACLTVDGPTDAVPAPDHGEDAPPAVGGPAVNRHDGPAPPPVAGPAPTHPHAETSVRVEVGVLDRLLDLVGELSLAQSRVAAVTAGDPDGPLAQPDHELRLVTARLQSSVMEARLQPLGLLTGTFHRVARDVAASVGRTVTVEVSGEDVHVDKAVIEALRDPLLHLVRNAVDHGIESADDRRAAGKPAAGHLAIRAAHQGSRVVIDVTDDGRGIDTGRLVDKAVRSGLLTADQATALDEESAVALVFRPGLSSRDEATSLSGRGVGMDAVRAGLDAVGGSVDLRSTPGRGTHVRITVPLTLSILPVLLVWCGGQRYAVPQLEVEEVVRPGVDGAGGDGPRRDSVGGAPVLLLRDELLPLVDLAGLLGVDAAPVDGRSDVVVLRHAGRRFGLSVDSVGDALGTTVKPLTASTRSLGVFAGATVLGDGRLALILDLDGVTSAAGLTARSAALPVASGSGEEPVAEVLVLAGGGDQRFAVPVESVTRLERFDGDEVERRGGVAFVHYRGGVLPLVSLPGSRPGPLPGEDGDGVRVVVCPTPAGAVGVAVVGVEDVASVSERSAGLPVRAGVADARVADRQLLEVLDLDALAAAALAVAS